MFMALTQRVGATPCDFCGKNTRETGHDESDLGICKACYLEAGDINSVNYGNMTEAEFEEIHGKPFYG